MDKSLAIMQPYFFPYLGYFQLINSVDDFVLYDQVAYIKNGWINRNRLVSTNSHVFYITVPLSKKRRSTNYNISEVMISNEKKYRSSIMKSIEHNYHKTPYFKELRNWVKEILHFETESISKFNLNSLNSICSLLEIKPPIILSAETIRTIEAELQEMNLPRNEIKYERIRLIANLFKSKVYINPIGGIEIYEREKMEKFGLKSYFLKMNPLIYRNKSSSFVPNLSTLDVLFNIGPEATKGLLREYDLM